MKFGLEFLSRLLLCILCITKVQCFLEYRIQSDEESLIQRESFPSSSQQTSDLEEMATSYLSPLLLHNGDCTPLSLSQVQDVRQSLVLLVTALNKHLLEASQKATDSISREALAIINLKTTTLSANLLKQAQDMESQNCLCCSCFVNQINDFVQELIGIVEKKYPQMENYTWFKTLITFINGLLSLGNEVCGDSFIFFAASPLQTVSYKGHVNRLGIQGILADDVESCLTKEQKDDVEEVLQLAGNLLNTFSQWLRESEGKAQSKEFKYILEKLAGLLDSDRELLETNGEKTIEHVCVECAQIVHFVSEVFEFGETILKALVPFWSAIPYLEDTLAQLDAFLAKAREVCPYHYMESGLDFSSRLKFSCSSQEFNDRVKSVQLSAAALSVELGSSKYVTAHSPIPELILFASTNTCLSCTDILMKLDTFLDQVESKLDSIFPKWRDTPFFDVIDNFVHETISNLEQYCPDIILMNKFVSNCKITRSDNRKTLIYTKSLHIINMIELAIVYASNKNVESQRMQMYDLSLTTIHRALQYVDSVGVCSLCDNSEKIVASIIDGIVQMKEETNIEEVVYIENLIIGKLNDLLGYIKDICEDSHNLFPQDILPLTHEILSVSSESNVLHDILNTNSFLRGTAKINPLKAELDCRNIIDTVNDIFLRIENGLDKIAPAWRDLPAVPELDGFVHEILDFLGKECDSRVKSLLRFQSVKKVLQESGESVHCLTEDEKETLNNVTVTAKRALYVAAEVLELRGSLETDPFKKAAIKEVAEVVRIAGTEIVSNITILADEFCGECSQLVAASKDVLLTVENALFDVEPMWKNTPIYSGVERVTSSTFEYLTGLCSKSGAVSVKDKGGCLTPDEQNTLRGYISAAESILNYASSTLEGVADSLADGEVKDDLVSAAAALRIVDKDLVKNFTHIADETCGTCADILQGLGDFEQTVENALSDIDKEWRSNGEMYTVALAVRTIIGILKTFCPENLTLLLREQRFLKMSSTLLIHIQNFPQTKEVSDRSFQLPKEDILLWLQDSIASDVLDRVDSEHTMLLAVVLASCSSVEQEINEIAKSVSDYFDRRQLEVLRDAFYLVQQSVKNGLIKGDRQGNIVDCEAIVSMLDQAIQEVKKMIEEIIPSAKNSDIFNEAVNFFELLLDMLHDYCSPQVMVQPFVLQ